MDKHVALTSVELDPETAALLDEVARERGMSREALAAFAIRESIGGDVSIEQELRDDPEFAAFVQVGIDAADRGDFVSHEEVIAKLEAMRAKYEARCRK